jgi:hypothetical protein
MIVWLWDARGPERCVRGVTDDQWRARTMAEESAHSVGASEMLVEQAYADLGTTTLTYGYRRTGWGWHGRRTSGGEVAWDRLTAADAALALPAGRF